MKRILVIMLWLNMVVYLPGTSYGAVAAETAGQILAKLSKLPPEQREKVLVERARNEGQVSFYSSLQAQQIDPSIQIFVHSCEPVPRLREPAGA